MAAIVAGPATAVQATANSQARAQSPFPSPLAMLDSGHRFAQLNAVAALGPNDAWTVGVHLVGASAIVPLTEHWNGTSWAVVENVVPPHTYVAELLGIDALSTNDVWAVGQFRRLAGPWRTLVEHWNGASWHRVLSPSPGHAENGSGLAGVSIVSATDIWAVGYVDPAGPIPNTTLMLHWNGRSWSTAKTPNPEVNRLLLAVDMSGPTAGWSVGATLQPHTDRFKALVEHWNGRRWDQAPILSPGAQTNVLRGVSVVGPGNVWAVGEKTGDSGEPHPLIEHRFAGRWRPIVVPGLGGIGELDAISGSGPSDVWMVGTARRHAILVHWDGVRWSRFGGPGATKNRLLGVTAHSTSATFAVGTKLKYARLAVHERWNGRIWTR
jgi:hypothetical protein